MLRWLRARLHPNDAALRRLFRDWSSAREAYRLHREELGAFGDAGGPVVTALSRALEADEVRLSEIEAAMAALTPETIRGARLQALVLDAELRALRAAATGPFAGDTVVGLAERLVAFLLRRGGGGFSRE